MSVFLVIISFPGLYFFSAALADFSEMVCEAGQGTSSQLDSGNFCNATNLSSDYTLSADSAQFAYNLPEQVPGHLFSFIETTREIHQTDVTGQLGILGPQFTGAVSYSNMSLPSGEVVWNDGQHVIGEISFTPGEFQVAGEIEYEQHEFFVPSKAIGGELTGIPRTTGELARPTKLRRFLKLIKRACLTYALVRCR
jgi:hypothetical protein